MMPPVALWLGPHADAETSQRPDYFTIQMKQYIYKAPEANFDKWPPGELRLDGIEKTENPADADIFVCPASLDSLAKAGKKLSDFPYFRERESRHVFFDVADNDTVYHTTAILIRCNLRTWMKAVDVNSISWAWPVEDFGECAEVPTDGFKYDVSFHGWVYHASRRDSVNSCIQTLGLRCDIKAYNNFFGYAGYTNGVMNPEGKRRRTAYIQSMRESRVCLCPEQIDGVFPYRFFEAMSAGRVPVLIGSDYVFPFRTDEIPYEAFALLIPRLAAHRAGKYIEEYLRLHPDGALITKGKIARAFWLKYLNHRDWTRTMSEAVQKAVALQPA